MLYPNNLKNREFGKEASQIFRPAQAAVLIDTARARDEKSGTKPTTPKTDSSGCLGIDSNRTIIDLTQSDPSDPITLTSDAFMSSTSSPERSCIPIKTSTLSQNSIAAPLASSRPPEQLDQNSPIISPILSEELLQPALTSSTSSSSQLSADVRHSLEPILKDKIMKNTDSLYSSFAPYTSLTFVEWLDKTAPIITPVPSEKRSELEQTSLSSSSSQSSADTTGDVNP